MPTDSRNPYTLAVDFYVKRQYSTVVLDGADTSANLSTINLADPTKYDRYTVTPYVISAQVVSVYGTSGVLADGTLVKDSGTLTGNITLNIRAADAAPWAMLSSFCAGTVIHFTLGGSNETPVTYRTKVFKPSLDLRADGIIATYSFVTAELYDLVIAGSSSSDLRATSAQLREASRTHKTVYSTKTAAEQYADSVAQLGMGGTGNRGKVNPNAPKVVPRKPHEIFEEIAAVCKWNTTGTFGRHVGMSTVEKSDVPVAGEPRSWTQGKDFYHWVGYDLASACITNRNVGYDFFFGTDDTGKTVAHFHSKTYDVRYGTTVSADDPTLPTIEYGGGRSMSGVIQCQVDSDILSAALLQAGSFYGTDADGKSAASSLPAERRQSTVPAGSLSGSSVDVGIADDVHRHASGRTPAEVKAYAIHCTTPEDTGLRMILSLVGTRKYLVGSMFRFIYYLPDGQYLPIVSNIPYQVQSATHQITEQGYTTTIEALAMSIPREAAPETTVVAVVPPTPNLLTGTSRAPDLIPGTNTVSFDQPPVLGENVFNSYIAYKRSAKYREDHLPKQVTVAPDSTPAYDAAETSEDGE